MRQAVIHSPSERSNIPRNFGCGELLRLHDPQGPQHVVQFYEDENIIIDNVSYLAVRTLAAGDSVVVVATESHRSKLRQRLAHRGIPLDALIECGRCVMIDAAEALSKFMVGGAPDEAKFAELIGRVIRDAARKSTSNFVFAFGEMVALLCADGHSKAALRLEQLWNSLAQQERFSLYCAYSLDSLGRAPDADALLQICDEHALTFAAEMPL
jgi:hypothetical protein